MVVVVVSQAIKYRFGTVESLICSVVVFLQVCQDFLRGKCERDSCRYLHPPDHLRSRIRDVRVLVLPEKIQLEC